MVTLGATTSPQPIEAAQDPAGNNGTVKVDGDGEWDRPNPPNANDPHVECEFEVVFYNFDKGTGEDFEATVTFEFQPPTTRPDPGADQTILTDKVFIGEDPAGGGQDEDARELYDLQPYLTGVEPHEEQGYHVKLTIHAPGSQGNDTKHKVFWVDECPEPPGPTTTTTTAATTTTTTVEEATTTTTAAPTTTTTAGATTTTVTAVVEGIAEEKPPTTPGAVPGTPEVGGVEEVTAPPPTLPRTGPRTGFLYSGLGLMLTGLGFLALGRRR
jgi:LPXTG-motif cell wall-anchored protein